MTTIYAPSQGVVLIKENTSEFGPMNVPGKAHDSQTSGLVVQLNPLDSNFNHLMDKTVVFRKYRDDARLPNWDKSRLVFIEINDILGSFYEAD